MITSVARLLILILSLFSFNAFSKTQLNEGIVKEYLKIQKEFSNTVCRPNMPSEYEKLAKNYLGDGRYIPTLLDEKLDYGVIKNFISLMNEKTFWIRSLIDFVNTSADYPAIEKILELLDDELNKYYQDRNIAHVEKIKLLLDELKEKAPFLISFKFPLDHLKLRAEYDQYKNTSITEARRRANSIFFYRRIVQDGTFNEEMTRTDSTVRAAFDTLYLSIQDKLLKKMELADSDRVDLLFLIRNFSQLLKEGKKKQVARLTEWELRTNRSLDFYKDLLISKKSAHDVLLNERANALYNLKKFVLTNEAHAYEFWAKRSELMQALFVIETILYNEIGRADVPDALERRDVAQVVINRFENDKYNTLTSIDSITPYLASLKNTTSNKWLNILFKEGEFSFTYFYIPGNFHIYCPDMSRTGQFYRKENARIALELLNRPRKNFMALRYFSRVSMYGRISMDSLWTDFVPLPEVPGNLVKNNKRIESALLSGKSRLLYKFTNHEMKKTFQVVEVKSKKYVVDETNTKNIYHYRSPHLFRYFAPIK